MSVKDGFLIIAGLGVGKDSSSGSSFNSVSMRNVHVSFYRSGYQVRIL